MTLHRLVFAFALGGAALYGCGSDTTSDNSPATIPPVGAGKMDAGASTTPPSSDAGRPADAALAVDSGASRNDGGTAVDSGARDSGTAADSGKAQDSGTAVDSGTTQSTADSGMPMMSAAGDPRSSACSKCEMAQCDMKKWPNAEPDAFKDCSAFGTETALDGMGMGKMRRTLCEEAVACIRETRCADPLIKGGEGMNNADNPDVSACLCGMPYESCTTAKSISDLKGPCRDKMADAAETNDLQTILERTSDPSFALGAADRRIICSQNLCADECYAPCANAPDGASCAGVKITASEGGAPKPGAEGTCKMKSCVDYYSQRYNEGVTLP